MQTSDCSNRLANSRHASSFILKGAALFTIWTGKAHRATRDVDLLGFGDPGVDRVREVLAELIGLDVPDDGVRYELESLHVGPIREEQEYDGVRAELFAYVTAAKIRLQIDVGFGDAVTPDATEVEFPALLDFPAPTLRAYPRETVVAEKLEAITQLGLVNTRMKDFYDLAVLACDFEFEGELLVRAIRATFERRKTPLPDGLPTGLTAEFADEASKQTQWSGFMRKTGARDFPSLGDAIGTATAFAEEPLAAAANGCTFQRRWPARGPWKD